MPNVQPTNNPVPSDNPADARDNFKRIDEVVNSTENLTSPTRTGVQLVTLHRYSELVQPNIDGAEAAAAAAAASAAAAEAAVSGLDYQGLWPDSGGSANKGDTYQTQIGGVGTGQYFTALQNTTVEPVGDDVNWRAVIGADLGSVSNGTKLQLRRGPSAEIAAGTPAIGELWVNTTDSSIHMGDGATPGGIKHVTVQNGDRKYTGPTFKDDTNGTALENMIAGRVNGVVSITHTVGNVYRLVSDDSGGDYIVGNQFDDLKAIAIDGGLFARPVNSNPRKEKISVIHNDGSLFNNHGVMRVAHRNGGYGVNNSVYNYQKMLDSGKFDAIEIDMCISADGVLYNYHDVDVSLETNGTGMLYELNSSYIDTLKFNDNQGTVFKDDPIPRLTEIFDLVRETGCWLFAEAKFFRGGYADPQYDDVKLMLDLAEEYGIMDKFVLAAFDKTTLITAADYKNTINVMRYVSTYSEGTVSFSRYIPTTGAVFLGVAEGELNGDRAAYIRGQGMIPAVWTVNSAISQQRWVAAGVSIIISDDWGIK